MLMMFQRKLLLMAALLLAVPLSSAYSVSIYKNEACGHCTMYIGDLSNYLLSIDGVNITEKNMINDPSAREELNALNLKYGIPIQFQGHLVVNLNNEIFLEGHVPIAIVKDYFANPEKYKDVLAIYQDNMAQDVADFKILTRSGKENDCNISAGLAACTQGASPVTDKSLFWIVVASGLLAGIHPCTISVLLFFIAFLITLRKTRLNIFGIGSAYIFGIFLAYFFIGLGVLKAFSFGQPHLAAKVAGALVLILGLANLFNFLFPHREKKLSFGIPDSAKEKIVELVHEGSVPAALLIGIIVGICSFGCTAGIYFSITGLLISSSLTGASMLLLYNIMFILPLIAILVIATDKRMVERLEQAEKKDVRLVKLVSALLMIALAAYLLFGLEH